MLDKARGGTKLVGYQEIKCHMIFDIKMDFTRKAQLPDGTMAWSIGADEYVDNALAMVKATLKSEGMKLKGKVSKPLPNGYRPEMDVSPECNAVMT